MNCYAKVLIGSGEQIYKGTVSFLEDSLFITLINVNFNGDVIVK
ncbi:hypothetical protein [Clostridioides sp. ZZV14-6345]